MEDIRDRVLLGCALSLLIVGTLFGNTLVCVAVIRFRHLRCKITNLFVVSLAVSDLCVGVLVMPWKAVAEVAEVWYFGSTFCNIWVAFDIMCCTASILSLCIISVDRYWAISSPFRYQRRMTQRMACVMIATAWTVSLLISFIPVQLNWHSSGEEEEVIEEEDEDMLCPSNNLTQQCAISLNATYAITSSLISFYIPVAIMVATYTQIYRIAKTQIRRISLLERAVDHSHLASLKHNFRKETKVLKTLSIIMGVFVFCWLPFFVVNCLVPFCDARDGNSLTCVSDNTFNVFVWFGWANSSFNPIIYAFNIDFRRAFASILGCRQFCPGGTVETFTPQGVSYHDSTNTRDTPPRRVGESEILPFDRFSSVSGPSHRPTAFAALRTEYDAEISLDMTAFAPTIPGQVIEDGGEG